MWTKLLLIVLVASGSASANIDWLYGFAADWLYEGPSEYDLNGDGIVNFQDWTIITGLILKDNWAVAWLWRPEITSAEVFGTLPIATLHGVDGGTIQVVFNGAEDRFEITDGSDSVNIDCAGWLHGDTLKFALSQDTANTAIYIETPAEGTLKDETANDIAIAGEIHFLQFSAGADRVVNGVGLYGEIKYYDKELAEAAVQKIFDLDPTAETPVLAPKVSDLVFARDSIRFDRYVEQVASGKALIESVPVVSRIPALTVEAAPDDTDQRPMWIEGDRLIVARVTTLRSVHPTTFALTEVLNTATTEPFASEIGATSIQTGKELPDGSRLMSLSGGYIYRWDPATEEWSQVLRMGAGDPFAAGGVILQFGWSGISGDRVVIGEYGTTNDVNQGRRVYLSEDSGKTWGMIYDRDKTLDAGSGDWTSAQGWHVHLCVFHPSNPDVIYVAYGDSSWRQIVKLTYSGSGDRLSAANWSATGMGLEIQPTAGFTYSGKIYWGQDGETYDQTIIEHDPSDDSFKGVLLLPRLGGTYPESPFDSDSGGGFGNSSYVWRITRIGGVIYAGMSGGNGDYSGIFCSVDGRAWTRAYTVAGVNGVRDFIGVDSEGRLWVEYGPSGGGRKPGYLTPPKIKQVDMVQVEGGATNALSVANSYFDEDDGDINYRTDNAVAAASGWDNTVKLYGGGSAKMIGEYKAGQTYLRWDLQSPTIGVNEYFRLLAHFRLGGILQTPGIYDHLPERTLSIKRFQLNAAPSDTLRYERCRVTMLRDGWFVAVIQGRNLAEVAWSGELTFILYPSLTWRYEDADWSEIVVHTDCLQVLTSANPIYRSNTWQPGGTPRSDEILIAPASLMRSALFLNEPGLEP